MKKAVVYGAGNIGRGFIGQLLSQSFYQTVFLDINEQVVNLLNQEGKYPVSIVENRGEKEIWVHNVRAVNSSSEEAAAEEIFDCDIMATSVGVNVLKFIARPVAAAIERRIAAGRPPLNILLCENLMAADKYFKEQLLKHLSANAAKEFDSNVGLVEASIGRMVPVLEKKPGENPLRVYVEAFDILHLDRAGFAGEVPNIKNVITYTPFDYYIRRKLFIHNMTHAAAAYLGAVIGSSFISDAVSDARIKYIINMAGTSSARAIAAAGAQPEGPLLDFLHKLIYRFNNRALKDSVARVAKDPVRKLGADDRLVGAYRLCKEHGIPVDFICAGIAAALVYSAEDDSASLHVSRLAAQNGAAAALKEVSGYDGFNDGDLEFIAQLYDVLKEKDIDCVLAMCESRQADGIANL